MKWKKHGMIFSAEEYSLEYAKSPQAIELDDCIRIYFSACKKDGEKWISYVCYADFSKDFKEIHEVKKQILPDGKLGCFDEHGIFPFSPVEIGDKVYAYTSGWSRRVSVSVDTGIGLAVSDDGGASFSRVGEGPVLTSSLNEPFLVIDAFVRKFEGRFHMWYIYGKEWKKFCADKKPERIYKIAHAVSDDGIEWCTESEQIIEDRVEEESQALPCVIYFKGMYHMFFCYRYSFDFRENREKSYRLGLAVSTDLKTWKRCDEKLNFPIEDSGWDSQMNCYPNVFMMNDKLYMLYNGNHFGREGFGLAELEEYE